MNGLKKCENGGFWEGFIEEWENLTQEHYVFFELQFTKYDSRNTIHELRLPLYCCPTFGKELNADNIFSVHKITE